MDKGKQEINKCKNTKITTDKHKIQKTLDYEKSNSNGKKETDEQRIKRLMKEGKTNPNANYVFDQNGNLFMVTWD